MSSSTARVSPAATWAPSSRTHLQQARLHLGHDLHLGPRAQRAGEHQRLVEVAGLDGGRAHGHAAGRLGAAVSADSGQPRSRSASRAARGDGQQGSIVMRSSGGSGGNAGFGFGRGRRRGQRSRRVERLPPQDEAQPGAGVGVHVEGLDAVAVGLGLRGLGVDHVEGVAAPRLVVGLRSSRRPFGPGHVQLGGAEDARLATLRRSTACFASRTDLVLEGDAVLRRPCSVGPGLGDLACGAQAVEDGDR